MPRDFISRDRKLRNKKGFKPDDRKSVRNLDRILERLERKRRLKRLEKTRDIKEKNSRINKENGYAYRVVT